MQLEKRLNRNQKRLGLVDFILTRSVSDGYYGNPTRQRGMQLGRRTPGVSRSGVATVLTPR